MMRSFVFSILFACAPVAFAAKAKPAAAAPVAKPAPAPASPALQDLDALGGNGALFERARALSADGRMRVVQDRAVPRKGRWEFAPEIAGVIGGDAYNKTTTLGLNVQRHFSAYWSAGLKVEQAFNALSPEGESMLADTRAKGGGPVPDVDYPKRTFMAIANVYPLYGKLNLFEAGVAHFDLYGVAGAGVVQLRSGNAATVTAGAGAGFWFTQRFDTRVELRWQRYRAQRFDGDVAMNTAVLSWQLGYLL